MISADALTFREFVMSEKLPLATIHKAVLEFLRGREDAVLFGAYAVNAYVSEPRMTQDIDLLSTCAEYIAQQLRGYLNQEFHIAIRVRKIGEGRGYRLYQVRRSGNRHLVDIRSVKALPLTQRIGKILVMAPIDLIASKVISYYQRHDQPKSGTDWRDLAMLLLTFPELKTETGPVLEQLKAADVEQKVLDVWKKMATQEIRSPEDNDEF
jgi:hypothetical protein